MAADLSVIYRIAADITGLEEGVNRGAKAAESLEGTVARVGKAIGAAFSVQQVTQFARVTTQAFGEEEAALRKLEAALVSQGNATPGVIQDYNNLANQFQKTTVFSDDLITEMEALLVQVGNVMPNEMQKALTAATDLAAGLGIDLRTATLLVGKAFEGETGTLKRYGIVIDDAKLKTQGIGAVLDAVNQKFGGQAAAQLDTYSGKMQRLGNEVNNAQEEIGGFLADGLNPLADAFSALPTPVQATIGGVAALTPSLEQLTLAVIALGGPAGALTAGTAAVGALGTALAVLWPVVAVGATAFVAWKLAEHVVGIEKVSDALHWMTGKLIGLTDAQIEANKQVREAREWVEIYESAAGAIDKATRNAPKLRIATTQVGMSAQEVDATIKEMNRSIDVQNEKRRAAAEAQKTRWAEEARLIQEREQLEAAAALERARQLDFIGLREIQAAEEEFQRGERQRQAEQQWADQQLSEQRQLQNELGVLNMQAEAERLASLEKQKNQWKTDIKEMGEAFVDMSHVAEDSFGLINRAIGTMILGVDTSIKSIGQLKNGLTNVGSGNTLQGIASIASGIAGIVGVANAAIGAVKALWNWARGGEEGTVVNPARDRWFAEHGTTVEGVGARLEAAGIDGDAARQMIESVFQADTKAEFDAAIAKFGGLPGFAKGGLIRQPTIGMLGEAGPELVTPLSQLGHSMMREIVIPVTLVADGRTIAKVTARNWASVLELQGVAT